MKIDKKYFRHVMFEDCTIAALSHDGQIYMFDHKDIVPQLNRLYQNDSSGWFFNNSHDRYCAEMFTDYVTVNPSAVIEIFGFPVLFEDKEK